MILNKQVEETIEDLRKSGINGCVAGSSMLVHDCDFDTWDSVPDIDVFVYNEVSYGYAMAYVEGLGFKPGGKGKRDEAEEVRKSWTLSTGIARKYPVNTIQYHKDDIAVNITYKRDADSLLDVVCSFDMSCIMIGMDLITGHVLDLRGDDRWKAEPNPYKQHLYNHPSRFTVERSLRQWDRVIKYAGRGFDTIPMAEFYLKMIKDVRDAGAIFGTQKDQESFDSMEPGFAEMQCRIEQWLKEVC